MTILHLTKLEAAVRQLNAAIRMTFGEEDPTAICTVVFASNRIIRDLCDHHGNIQSYIHFTDWINPSYKAEFWRLWNAPGNFLKHADNDSESLHELNVEAIDILILLTIRWCNDLGCKLTPEFITYFGWATVVYPRLLNPNFFSIAGIPSLNNIFQAAQKEISALSRPERLRLGAQALKQALSHQPGIAL